MNRVAFAVAILLLVMVDGCADGSGEMPVTPPSIWLSVDSPEPAVEVASIDLTGPIECRNCPPPVTELGVCLPIVCPDEDMMLTWTNAATGESGPVLSGYAASCSCLFSYCISSCRHAFTTTVPLTMGTNTITIDAVDGAGITGAESVSVLRRPAPPMGLVATASATQVMLEWDASAEATAYDLHWSTSPDVGATTGAVVQNVEAPYVHAGLESDVTYYYVLVARSGATPSAASAVVAATPGWSREVLLTTSTAMGAADVALDTDAADRAHVYVAYDDRLPGGTVFHDAYVFDEGTAFSASLSIANPVAADAELALGLSDVPYFSLLASSIGAEVAHVDLGGTTVDHQDVDGMCETALAIDAAGHSHLAYFAAGGELRYATDASGTWSSPTTIATFASSACGGGGELAIAVTTAGVPHVFAARFPEYGLRHLTDSGSGFVETRLGSAVVSSLAATIDAADQVHLVFVQVDGLFAYATDVSGSFRVDSVDSSAAPTGLSVVTDSSGAPWVSYVDALRAQLRIAHHEGSGFRVRVLAATASLAGTAIAVDTSDRPHVAYFVEANGATPARLEYARRSF